MTGDSDRDEAPGEVRDERTEVPRLDALRWPLEALCRTFGTTDVAVIAERCGVSVRSVRRARTEGLTDEQADQWAIYAGLHPVLVWGWAWVRAGQHGDDVEGTDDGQGI